LRRPDATYRALTTTGGVAGWWTDRNETFGVTGQVDRFHFPGVPVSRDMRVEQAEPGKLLVWHCIGGPPEWVGTEVRWTLQVTRQATSDVTLVLLDHTGFAAVDSTFRTVTLGWAQMLLRLRDYLRTGTPTPFFQH
jgi:uncharacterized protein YndB with AHSA1/START domain